MSRNDFIDYVPERKKKMNTVNGDLTFETLFKGEGFNKTPKGVLNMIKTSLHGGLLDDLQPVDSEFWLFSNHGPRELHAMTDGFLHNTHGFVDMRILHTLPHEGNKIACMTFSTQGQELPIWKGLRRKQSGALKAQELAPCLFDGPLFLSRSLWDNKHLIPNKKQFMKDLCKLYKDRVFDKHESRYFRDGYDSECVFYNFMKNEVLHADNTSPYRFGLINAPQTENRRELFQLLAKRAYNIDEHVEMDRTFSWNTSMWAFLRYSGYHLTCEQLKNR